MPISPALRPDTSEVIEYELLPRSTRPISRRRSSEPSGFGAYYDVGKFVGISEASLRGEGKLEILGVALGLGADAFAEELPLRETESRDPFRLGRELPIDRDLEPVGPCGVENPAHLVGRGCRVRTRKK